MRLDRGAPGDQRGSSITQLFTEQRSRRGGATAVTCGDITLSYADFDIRSDRVALWLVEHGVRQESIVGVSGERSAAVMVALLGILKAGGAYLALDPDAPAARSRRLLADAHAAALIGPPGDIGIDTLLLNDVLSLDSGRSNDRPPNISGDTLAYVSFTSGSTGHPKGVCIPHKAVVRLARAMDLDADDSVLHLSPLSFDASTFEIWVTLLRGGRVVIHPSGPVSLDEVATTLVDNEVTTAWFTSGFFSRMVDMHMPELAGLRQVLTGGDVVSPAHVNRLLDRYPDVRVMNCYGPTENTTFTCCHVISGPINTGSVPIGEPISGTQVHILDDALQPALDGVPGELYTTGDGLSRGYLGMPGHTAAAFLPDPFGVVGARMYRTGDLVRRLADGTLEFLGRVDDQAKIRGFRVEPAEIETAIRQHPDVGQAVVVTRDDIRPGERCLLAYLTIDTASGPAADDLATDVRRLLHETLPRYMMPVAFLVLDELPLSRAGKVDRSALPSPVRMPRDVDSEFVSPSTPVEELLCDMWEEALGVTKVGARDDFFQLGGNSLLAVDLIARMVSVLRIPLSVRQLLFHPTVAELADAIAAGETAPDTAR